MYGSRALRAGFGRIPPDAPLVFDITLVGRR